MTLNEAIEALYVVIAQKPIAGAVHDLAATKDDALRQSLRKSPTVFYGSWDRGWGAGAIVRCCLTPAENRGKPIWLLECEVSWSASGRSVSAALACVTLYREVVELAAYLESAWGHTVEREPNPA